MDAAYVAGILDGEGCLTVGLNKAKQTYDARAYVGMTEKAISILRGLHERYGGSLRCHRAATQEWVAAWMWSLCGKDVLQLLKDVLPRLVLKDRQARLLLELEEMKPGGRNSWTDEMRARAAGIRATVMELNRKGPDSPQAPPPIPGMEFVRDVDGMLLSPKPPDLFSDSAWQPWSGPFANAGISVPGGFWTQKVSEWPSIADGYSACSLANILESDVSPKYSLSAKAGHFIPQVIPLLEVGKRCGEGDERTGLGIGKPTQIRNFGETVDLLYGAFIARRLSSSWGDELTAMQKWLRGGEPMREAA